MDTNFIEQLKARQFESYLVETRNSRVDTYSGWRTRTEIADALVRDDWVVAFPNHVLANERPMIQNTAQVMVRDVPRLVSEQQPSMRSIAKNDTDTQRNKKQIREAVADTYWLESEAELLVPLWTMDLLITGTAFSTVSVEEGCQYPVIDRIDPRLCFPDVYNGKLQDLVVTRRMKLRQAERLFTIPEGMYQAGPGDKEEVEIIEYYGPKEQVRAIASVSGGTVRPDKAWIIDAAPLDLDGQLTVQFAQLPSHDGSFTGMIEQVGNSLLAKNKIVRLMTQYADQQVAAPFVAKGVINPNDKPGPNTVYHIDPNVAGGGMDRVQPAGGSPQLYALLQMMDSNERGQLAYPEARQGNVSQSIASASFVAATQGQLSSVVRECQKYIGRLREQATSVAFKLDAKHLDFDKPIVTDIPAGRDNHYTPSDAIDEVYRVRAVYGASAGMDRLNADVRLLQFYGSGLLSQETARENIEFINDPEVEASRWEREQVEKALLQKFVGDPNAPFDLVLQTFEEMHSDGISFADAVTKIRAEAAKQAEAEVQPGAPQIPGQPPTPQVAPGAIEAGATSPQALGGAGEVEFNPPPLEQIFVGNG